MRKITILFFVILITTAFCLNKNNSGTNWISTSYIKCLEKQLPCECQGNEAYSFINLDTTKNRIIIHENIVYDPNIYDIRKIRKNQYQIYQEKYLSHKFKDTIIVVGTLQIISDTLFYINSHNKKISFIIYGVKNGDEGEYYKEHVKLINKALKKTSNTTLETILKSDSLSCNCNPELGTINLVCCNRNNYAWILETRKDSLFIYKWINRPNDKTVDLKIKKKLIKKIKYN